MGYKYEETIGFTAEYNAKDKMEGDTKYLDWSFDRKGFYNSKQWK